MTKRTFKRMNIRLEVAGMQLTNELRRQFDEGLVETYGHLHVDKHLLSPGEIKEVMVNKRITEAIEKGWIVSLGEVQ